MLQAYEIPHYRIVFFGKTGSGKSTLINMMFNILLKMEYTDMRYVAISVKIDGKK
jgi:predicted GTPase